MTIYVDVVLLENLCMNYAILFATGVVTRNNLRILRIIISSLIGGIYAVISFMNIFKIYSNLIFKIILSVVMVYICFKPKNLRMLFKQLIIFYLISFAFGGTAFALLYFIKPENIMTKNGLLIGTYPIKIALLGAIIGFIIIQTAFRVIKTKITKQDMFCYIKIYIKDKQEILRAMIDTGNSLKEPITGYPVIVVQSNKLENILPKEVLENTEKIVKGKIVEDLYDLNFRIIPFTSLGKTNGLLLGIKADKAIVRNDDCENILENVIIAIYDKELSKTGSYNSLVGLDILERSTNELIGNAKI